MYKIYLITNLINDKVYVGQTKTVGDRRWKEHLWSAKRGDDHPLYRAIRKHGVDNFTYVVLAEHLTKEEANEGERFWINSLSASIRQYGYVCSEGGDGRTGPNPELRWHRINAGRKVNPGGEQSPFFRSSILSEDIIRLFNEGKSQRQIAEVLGCKRGLVVSRLRLAEIPQRTNSDYPGPNLDKKASQETRAKMSRRWEGALNPRYRNDFDIQEMSDMYAKGLNSHVIARHLNTNNTTVLSRLKSFGVDIRSRGRTRLSNNDSTGESEQTSPDIKGASHILYEQGCLAG